MNEVQIRPVGDQLHQGIQREWAGNSMGEAESGGGMVREYEQRVGGRVGQ